MTYDTWANGNMPNTSKKRKAADLDSSRDALSTSSTRHPKKKSRKKKKSVASHDEIPFTTESPLVRLRDGDNAFVGTENLADGFSFDYAVRPGPRWRDMRSYRNVKYSDNDFTIGNVVYINKNSPPPKPPRANATDEEILAYDRTNFWVARIADTRAEKDTEVFIRVYWLYWPEELPMGRQPYHADNELVLSNAMDIVDAQTISSIAEVFHWDETDFEAKVNDRFWRQTFDVGQLGGDGKGGLSVLNTHCVCLQPYNPDQNRYQCRDPACGTWNHESCLIEDARARARNRSPDQASASRDVREIKEEDSKESLRFLSPFRDLGRFVQKKVLPVMNAAAGQVATEANSLAQNSNGVSTGTHHHESKKETPSPRRNGRQRSTLSSAENEDALDISLIEPEGEDGPLLARIEELEAPLKKTKKAKPSKTGRSWHINVQCLKCGKTMD